MVEMNIVILIGIFLLGFGVKHAMFNATQASQNRDIKQFINDTFDAMDLLYFESVNTSRCFGDVPESVSIASLVSDGKLDASYEDEQWYNPSSANLSYLVNSTTGYGYAMQIELSVSELAKGYPYKSSQYYMGNESGTDALMVEFDNVYFEKKLAHEIDESNWLYLGDDLCE